MLRRLAFIFFLVVHFAVAEERVLLLDDFDGSEKLSQRWTAIGSIGVGRVKAPANAPVSGVEGMLSSCAAEADSKFLVNQRFKRPKYEEFDKIRFRIRVEEATRDQPVAFEFQCFSQERRAALWRKFTISDDGWQVVELPMEFFRYTAGASLGWPEVSRFGFHFRQRCSVMIDGIELVASSDDANPYLTPSEIAGLAFGEQHSQHTNDRFAVLTNEKRVNGPNVLKELDRLFELIYADFPRLPKPLRRVPVLVFSKEDEYRKFWTRFGNQFASHVPAVRSDGYSLLGVAGTYHSEEYGSIRPVLLHEACHAILEPSLGLSNSSEWLHEGLANYYQLNWTKQDLVQLTRKRIDQGTFTPLRQLTNGERIRLHDYAFATLFVKWLIEDEARREQLFRCLSEMRQRNSTALEPICEKQFGKSVNELELEWIRWAKQQ